MDNINYWAVLVSALVSMVIGSIWYGPLFGKMYTHAIGMDQWTPEKQEAEKKKMNMMYALQFVASLVMFYVLASFIGRLGQMTVSGGAVTALWVWVGFMVPQQLGSAIWGGSMKLFWLGIGNSLLTLLATGAIIGAWK